MTGDELNTKIAMLMCEIEDLRTQLDEVAAQAAGAAAAAAAPGLGNDSPRVAYQMYWDPSFPVPARGGVPAHNGAWVMYLPQACCYIGKDACTLVNAVDATRRLELLTAGDWYGHAKKANNNYTLTIDQNQTLVPLSGEKVYDFYIGELGLQRGAVKQVAFGTVALGGDGAECDNVSTNLCDAEDSPNAGKIQVLDFEDGVNIPDTDFVTEICKEYGNYYDVVVRNHDDPKEIKYLAIGENINLNPDDRVPRVFEPEFGEPAGAPGVVIVDIGDGAWQYARQVSHTAMKDASVGTNVAGKVYLEVSHASYPPTASVKETNDNFPASDQYKTVIPLYKFSQGAITLDYRGYPVVQVYE